MGEKSPTDLMLHCSICKSSYSLSSVRDHKKHHVAMRVMRFKPGMFSVSFLCRLFFPSNSVLADVFLNS